MTRVVFLHDEVAIAASLGPVELHLRQLLRLDGLQAASATAFESGQKLLAHDQLFSPAPTLTVRTLPAYHRGGVTVVPIRWYTTRTGADAFSVMDANLELESIHQDTTRVSLAGICRQETDRFGADIDPRTCRHIARTTVGTFLAELGSLLAVSVRPPAIPA